MRQREIQISEREAYELYVQHLRARKCDCKPRAGALCAEGLRLHAEWRAAEEREATL